MRRCISCVSLRAGSALGLTALGTAAATATPTSAFMTVRCWESSTATAAPAAPAAAPTLEQQQQQQQQQQQNTAHVRASVLSTMEKAASARREIYDLWRAVSAAEETDGSGSGAAPAATPTTDADRIAAVGRLLDAYRVDPATPREEDVCRGLGDALDRLLLLCVPLPAASGTDQLERILQATGRQGRQLSVRTVQHLFARTGTFAEALAVFYALRRCHFAMSMESYHAMLYSLQRLEEEGWALRFHDETAESEANGGGVVSEQALDFILRGVDNQLIPENKPWLGRIMFAEQDSAAAARQSRGDFDEMGKAWVSRYKAGSSIPRV